MKSQKARPKQNWQITVPFDGKKKSELEATEKKCAYLLSSKVEYALDPNREKYF